MAVAGARGAPAIPSSSRSVPEPVTVAFATLGCKLNQYDTTELQARLEARGLRTVPFEEPAQLYVINTCTVTARADGSGRQAIRRAVARNPDALVVEQVEALVAAGYAEVVLTGVDLGHYGWDLAPRQSLTALVRRLLALPGLGRLRLSSILPAYVTDELIETIAGEPRVCRHLHVPLQSGSDRVLRAMRRPYNRQLYRRLVERLASALPGFGLGTD